MACLTSEPTLLTRAGRKLCRQAVSISEASFEDISFAFKVPDVSTLQHLVDAVYLHASAILGHALIY
jgi:hypothetical protein